MGDAAFGEVVQAAKLLTPPRATPTGTSSMEKAEQKGEGAQGMEKKSIMLRATRPNRWQVDHSQPSAPGPKKNCTTADFAPEWPEAGR